MNLKQFLHAKRMTKRFIASHIQRTFIGFNRETPKLQRKFKSYYFAHYYSARQYLIEIKHPARREPKGAYLIPEIKWRAS